jgi:hypothetical protein
MAIDPTISLLPPNFPFPTTSILDRPSWCYDDFDIQTIIRAMSSILQSCTTIAFFDLHCQLYHISSKTSRLGLQRMLRVSIFLSTLNMWCKCKNTPQIDIFGDYYFNFHTEVVAHLVAQRFPELTLQYIGSLHSRTWHGQRHHARCASGTNWLDQG